MNRLPGFHRGPHVAKRTWRDPKTGERLESAWYLRNFLKAPRILP